MLLKRLKTVKLWVGKIQ